MTRLLIVLSDGVCVFVWVAWNLCSLVEWLNLLCGSELVIILTSKSCVATKLKNKDHDGSKFIFVESLYDFFLLDSICFVNYILNSNGISEDIIFDWQFDVVFYLECESRK